ncbi:MAG: 50S ribosomal protein L17 [Paenibacillus macerans]|uniref:Large ribosomal subunit protein bL17 n=1 Tax=Paenibacillus macerans TaxID=44252 RepID=A0A6N8F519_PAEMA|nr:50S ribosomal protein L17 [Paenibacillus macerans]MBS5911122.1 50S ribosomal protein L17 [Paenibacillus macerans]MDU5947829.1 50S ribosomal protein L17 [Paenibacillus macerans]MDU7473358.1 50S ribosomal protein L17 [Paenibacillus macerans]MEC0139526.1 50S ribosomal protein L17 [Paenibacillus macerans]MUG25751.1 50S ribosomal protein L17 [Paenibacillus macerans]
MAYQKLGRDSSARKALFRDLVTDLFLYERIQTTEAKAKEVRSIAEKLITKAKRGDLHARRQVAAYVRRESIDGEQDAIQKLFTELAARYSGRPGGYTRILKLGPRRGDSAPMVYLELVDRA